MENFEEFRAKGIGGSDIAAILGKSPWASPLDIYLSKIGEKKMEETAATKEGKRLEPVILDWYADTHHVTLERSLAIIDKTNPIIRGNLDARLPTKIIEAKSSRKRNQWGVEHDRNGAIPVYYLTQVAYYASIVDVESVDIAVRFAFNYEVFTYHRNYKLEELLRSKALEFWEKYVVRRHPPEFSTLSDFKSYSRATSGKSIYIDNRMRLLFTKKKQLYKESKETELAIKKIIGDNEIVKDENDNTLATYKNCETNRFDTEEFKKDHLPFYKKYQKKAVYRRLLIR